MSYNLRIEGLLVEEESTYGTDPTPSPSTNGIRAVGRIWPAVGSEWAFENTRADVLSNSLVGVAPGPAYGRIVNLDFQTQLMGAGAAYSSSTPVRPDIDPLLVSCGMARTHDDSGDSESVTYDLVDTGHLSCTVYAYAGGKLFRIVGCRGTWTWNPLAGQLGVIRWQMQGMLSAAPTEASVPAITYDSVIPPAAVGMGLALTPDGESAWSPNTAGLEIMCGQELERLDDVNGADGLEGFEIVATNPMVRFVARTPDLSDYAYPTYSQNRLVHEIDLQLGTTQYNRVIADIDLAYLANEPGNEEEGRLAGSRFEYMARDMQLVFS